MYCHYVLVLTVNGIWNVVSLENKIGNLSDNNLPHGVDVRRDKRGNN